METTYTYESRPRRQGSRGRHRSPSRGRGGVTLGPRERRRLVQLCVCALLFGAVFFGRGIFPRRMEHLGGELLGVIQADTDFRAAFANLGQSISAGEPVTETLGTLWVEVFATGGRGGEVIHIPGGHTQIYQEERAQLVAGLGGAEQLMRRLGAAATPREEAAPVTPAPEASSAPAPEPVLPAQPQPVYTGSPMPEGATMERVDLGLGDTASPVVAAMASAYGWREHPIEGGEKFHSGVDLAGEYGAAIGAFADGVVEYIGESPAYGQYLKLQHGEGVSTFYAHCSKLCVQPGQRVQRGEKVAEVGDTGNVTGTHLHFELKQNGVFMNPLYYIETLP